MTGSPNTPLLELPDQQTWKLEDKVVLITGAASGIGAATARLAASDGAKVLVSDLPGGAGQALADEINGLYIELDVTSVSYTHLTLPTNREV